MVEHRIFNPMVGGSIPPALTSNHAVMEAEFLAKLVCPRTRKPLRMADQAELDRLNAAIAAGGLQNAAGRKIDQVLQEGLIPESGNILYPVCDGIPVLLTEEAIPLNVD